MFTYRATLKRIIDADTIEFIVDLGFNIHIQERFRLFGINAFERNTPEGKKAIEFVTHWFETNPNIVLVSEKPLRQEKYGRWLAVVHSGEAVLNDALIDNNFAVPYMT